VMSSLNSVMLLLVELL